MLPVVPPAADVDPRGIPAEVGVVGLFELVLDQDDAVVHRIAGENVS